MIHEKIFTIAGGKQIKMVVRGYYQHKQIEIESFVEIWVKERRQAHYNHPIGLILPKYGGLQKAAPKNIREMVVKASGMSDQQFDQVINEFKQITDSSVLL